MLSRLLTGITSGSTSNATNNDDKDGREVAFYIIRKSCDKPKTQIAAFTKKRWRRTASNAI